MEREYSDEKVIISRKRLEELEQESNTLKLQLEEERKKFMNSAKYCFKRKYVSFNVLPQYHNSYRDVVLEDTIYTNDLVVKELSDKIEQKEKAFEELTKKHQTLKSFYKLPFYKRIFHKTIKLK